MNQEVQKIKIPQKSETQMPWLSFSRKIITEIWMFIWSWLSTNTHLFRLCSMDEKQMQTSKRSRRNIQKGVNQYQ